MRSRPSAICLYGRLQTGAIYQHVRTLSVRPFVTERIRAMHPELSGEARKLRHGAQRKIAGTIGYS